MLPQSTFNIFFILTSIATTLTHCAQLPQTTHVKQHQSVIASKSPNVRIQCMSGFMVITIKDAPSTEDGYFSGMIYPKELSKNSTCMAEFHNHEGALKYKLPLRSCSTMPQETDDGQIEFFNTIVIQPHLKLVTDLTTSYHVRCRYKSREAATKGNSPINPQRYSSDDSNESRDRSSFGRSLDNSLTTNEMPGCHMKIYSDGKVADNVKIGDTLEIVVNIDEQNTYGLHVTDCIVRDGLGLGEQKLVNEEGCPMDTEIMGPFKYTNDRTMAKVSFPAHRFPYTSAVYYQCNVKLCALVDPSCHKEPTCDGKRIQKRATTDEPLEEGLPAVIEVYSGLYVKENAEVSEDDDDDVTKEKSIEDAICVSQRSFAIAIAIAGLVLMLLVVLAALCIMARRSRKTHSSSGSSIYSGPYTNTAFSHTS
uniref:CSON003393 protein n=2 Tax=Culicoides sonorensis TaxID=179676 RepID=A0A336MZ58_CULSO